VAGAITGTVTLDYAQAGVRQAWTGNATTPAGERVLQSLGLSPQATAITYGIVGFVPVAVDAAVANWGINAATKANRAATINPIADAAIAEADFAGRVPVRPRDGKVPSGTVPTDTPLGQHLIEAQVVGTGKNATVSGGHNMDNFNATIQQSGGTELSRSEIAPGIYQIEYQLPGGKVQPKTVYDPAKYSDVQMSDMASEAASKGLIRYQLTGIDEQFVKVGDVTFRVPIAIPGKNFSPTNPAKPYVPTAYPVAPKNGP
jgi:Bacterial EndoU nuclease